MTDDPAKIASERERIRAAAAEEVVRLQTALRETAAHAARQDREVERLTRELQKPAGAHPLRRWGGLERQRGRGEQDAGALERMLATFERERKQLAERARAVAATEARQRAAGAALSAEARRLAELERRLREPNAAGAAAPGPARAERLCPDRAGPSEELVARELELARLEEEVTRRELQLSLVRRRIGEEERRLQERAWRAGALEQGARAPVVPRRSHEASFSEGWRRLAGEDGVDRGDESGRSW